MSRRQEMFLPFQRLGDSGDDDGVGLGLAVAKGFVEAMGGDIEVEETPGGGLDDGRPAGGVRMTRILVVDDEPQILRALATNLRARDYDVDLAATGEEALTLAARKHPDLVIVDLGLPTIDGVEVIRGLRGWTEVPIIVLSVREGEGDKVDALDAGADDYVTKPFGMDELLARMRAALRRAVPGEEEAVVETGHFRADLAAKRVERDGEEIRLTPTEWQIVETLVRHPGRLITPAAAPPERLGPAVREGDELPPRLPRPDSAQARAGPREATLLRDRARHGLPVRALSRGSPPVGGPLERQCRDPGDEDRQNVDHELDERPGELAPVRVRRCHTRRWRPRESWSPRSGRRSARLTSRSSARGRPRRRPAPRR